MKIKIDKRILFALYNLSSKDKIRPFLKGVRIERKKSGLTYVATDGHKLGVYHDECNSKKSYSFTVKNDIIEKLIKLKKYIIFDNTLEIDTLKKSLTLGDIKLDNIFIEESTYPDWTKITGITKTSITKERFSFNNKYYNDCVKCQRAIFDVNTDLGIERINDKLLKLHCFDNNFEMYLMGTINNNTKSN